MVIWSINFLTLFFLNYQFACGSFFYVDSIRECYDNRCPKGDWFHYYTCNTSECDFHLQPYLYVICLIMVLVFLYSVICALMRFVCYFRQPSFYED
uniref:ORF8 n=1 Tax=Strongyloides stercoralis TaxID=6248 RepID=A0A0K0E179_STRER